VLLLAGLVWLPAIGARDLWSPDEPRIGQVAEEMRALHAGPSGLVMLHLGGEPYTQKPPLYYWLAAAIGAPFGHVDEWAARAPSVAGGLASLALTMALARRLLGPQAAVWAGLWLLASVRFCEIAQRAQLDALLTACELAAWLAFVRAERGETARLRARTWLHAALGAGMLVKGPVALLPLAAIAVHLALEHRTSELRSWLAPRGLALSLGPLLAWGGLVLALAPPGFFQEAVVENLLARFASGSSHVRPFYYYAYQLPLDFLPATLALPWAARAAWRSWRRPDVARAPSAARDAGPDADAARARAWRLLTVWVLVFVGFFSLSAGKRGLYLLPVFPALAIACGAVTATGLERRAQLPRSVAGGLTALAGALAIAAGALALGAPPAGLAALAGLGRELPDTIALPTAFFAALAVLAAGALGLAAATARLGLPARVRAAIALGTAVLIQGAVFTLLYPALDPERSLRPVARTAAALALPGEQIGVVHHVTLLPGLDYYAGGRPGRFVDLPDHAAILAFLASGRGAVLVSEVRRSWALEPAPLPRLVELRSGDRLLWVLAPPGRLRRLADPGPGRQPTAQAPAGQRILDEPTIGEK
jgi:4-amino-4-deoxy-L-arabinose transferase-like glycosyltransferase